MLCQPNEPPGSTVIFVTRMSLRPFVVISMPAALAWTLGRASPLNARPMIAKRAEFCFAREREALEHRLRGKPAPAQRAARRLLRDYQRGQRHAASSPPKAGILVYEFGPHGGGGGGGQDVAEIRQRGAYSSTYAGRRRGTRLVGLIPDGVASIDFTFARGHGVGPEGDRVYPKIYRRTVAVVANVVALSVPRSPEDAFFNRQVWHAADGSVINIVKPPFSRAG